MKKMIWLKPILLLGLLAMGSLTWAAGNVPGLSVLKSSTFIMGPGQEPAYPIDKSWSELTAFMKEVDVFDSVVERIESVLCSDNINKSVLLVGEPDDTFRYIFARLANGMRSESCPALWHFEADISKIEAGHIYVGQVEEYWENKILKPLDGKDGVIYFSGLGRLIGLGTHSNDSTGIESEYAANISGGRLKSVAFLDKYEYNNLQFSENTYVLNAHAEVIHIERILDEQVKKMIRTYMRIFEPRLALSDKNLDYLLKTAAYFQPNVKEPQRSLTLLKHLIRNRGQSFSEQTLDSDIQTARPYPNSMNKTWEVSHPDWDEIQFVFEYFKTEDGYDNLYVVDRNNNDVHLRVYNGDLGSFSTPYFKTNKIGLTFQSSGSGNADGFKIKSVRVRKRQDHDFTREDIRLSILSLIQVPEWLVTRDFTVIRELPGKLDGDVVGVLDAKKDIVRAVENGYVSGRTDEKPIGSSLLVGPTGTGKSYIAKKLAEFMDLKLITFDMTSFRTAESFDRFQELLAAKLVLHPFAIYLFEEIDKAGLEVLDRLYMMLDEGIFYDKFQRPLFARGAFLLMTTNAASDLIIRERNNPNLKNLVNKALQEKFRVSFLNRFDTMSVFIPFSDAEFHQLAKIMVSKKIQKLDEYYDWSLTVSDEVVNFLGVNGRSLLYGARPMERLIENVITTGFSKYQLSNGTIFPEAKIHIDKVGDADKNFFEISVEGRTSKVYEIDLDNNSGKSFDFDRELANFFMETRLY